MSEEDAFIYVAKENNIISEQTFIITFQRTDMVPTGSGFALAHDGEDYRGILQEFPLSFSPHNQRINLPFQLLPDGDPEATEAFQINLSSQGLPASDSADVLFIRTFVVIDDDDVLVRIGFEVTAYTVNEEVGVQEVCVRVFEPNETISLDAEITAAIATRVGTANETDYTPLNLDSVALIGANSFNNATRRNCNNVTITNDILVEGSEEFSLLLHEVPFIPLPLSTLLYANSATITILDQDVAVIGFLETNYSATESSGVATLTFGLISGGVQSNVSVQLVFPEGDAQAGADFDSTGGVFTFNASSATIYSFDVPLVSDDVYESIEHFTTQLSFVEVTDHERVTIDPNSAQVSIEDVRNEVVCRASLNCTGGDDDNLGVVANTEDCCLGNPRGLAYNRVDSDDCFACIVVGFLNASFSGFEQERPQSVPVAYLKGGQVAEQNLTFNVENTPGTAKEGSQLDYTVDTLNVTALANGQTDNVALTLRVDAVAQESNETFNLTLNPLVAPTPREGLFFLNTIQVTIVDSDIVEFFFIEDDYRANEPDSVNPTTFLPVLVSKSTNIASRIELVVVPLTIQEAIPPLPPNIPNDDPRSPPFANLEDFNNTNITLVFEPDEDAAINEKNASIFITDDAINEAEQVFIAELIPVSSLDPATIDLSIRPSTLCRIIDNDPMRIGFELPGYTYEEPQFDEFINQSYVSLTGQPDNGPIFLVKENNVTSEQTFLISLQVTDSAPTGIQSAMLDLDYRFGSPGVTSVTEFFPPSQQRIPFPFELLADTFPEGSEAFQARVSSKDSQDGGGRLVEQFPTSLNPLTLSSDIFITILDNDPITIGFSRTSYTVNENLGEIQLPVEVNGAIALKKEVSLNIETRDGSAVGGKDFMIANLQIGLNQSDSDTVTFVNYSIINDGNYEPTERFSVVLLFSDEPLPGVMLNPNSTEIVIIDDDVSQLIGAVVGSLSVLLLIVIVGLILLCIHCYRRYLSKKGTCDADFGGSGEFQMVQNYSVRNSYGLNVSPHLIIYASTIEIKEAIGQGEFGVVYKGHITTNQGKVVKETVAIKTTKGFCNDNTVRDMLKECSKMSEFDHPNVLTLRGVCLDGGPAPYIIMPFMTNGDLLTYLKNNRKTLVIASGSEDEEVSIVRKQLQDMCLQVARGMEYLAKMNVVHRDLAARNCMMDLNYVIKVGDFGLTESVGTNEYYRQNKLATVKLPVRWLAPESLEDYIFSEKSDVWAYGVTCWEIFTAGKVPYATINLSHLVKELNDGYRLEMPANDACDDSMYTFMLQCWELEPKGRPSFSDLVSSLSLSLEAMAGYMDVGAFGEMQVQPLQSECGDNSKKPEENVIDSSKGIEEIKLEVFSVGETCTSV